MTWKTKTAGILAIVAGVVSVIEFVFVGVLVIPKLGWLEVISVLTESGIVAVAFAIVIASAIVAVVSGVLALKRNGASEDLTELEKDLKVYLHEKENLDKKAFEELFGGKKEIESDEPEE